MATVSAKVTYNKSMEKREALNSQLSEHTPRILPDGRLNLNKIYF